MGENTNAEGRGEPVDGLGDAVDALPDLLFVVDGQGRLRHTNAAVEGIVGGDAAGTAATAVVDGDERELIAAAIDRARDSGGERIEAVVAADGHPYEFEFRPLSGGANVVGLGRANTPYETAINRMTDAFFAVDREWRITYVNERAQPILAEAAREPPDAGFVGRTLWDVLADAVDTEFYDRYHEAMEGQDPVTFETRYDPLDMWAEVRAYPSESGLSVYFRDVTERVERERRLKRQQETLQEMYDVISDPDRSFDSQIEALLALGCEVFDVRYGTLSQVVDGEYVFEVVHSPDERVETGMTVPMESTTCERTVSAEQRISFGDIEAMAPDIAGRSAGGDWRTACYLGAPVWVDDELYGTFCFYDVDPRESFSEWELTVTDLMARWVGYERTRRQVADRLRRQNGRLEEFVSVVSHDLRNPLNVVAGSIQQARETGDPDAFDRAERGTDRMETLIEDLLSLSRSGEEIGEREWIDLSTLVEHCWETAGNGDAQLSVETDAVVSGDESRLRQLFENLIRNAIEHGAADGNVTVGNLPDGFYVADDGPGVPPEDRERIFEAGYSTAEEGTGFGLGIVRRVAEAHGWSVTATESEDGGARFDFTGVDTH